MARSKTFFGSIYEKQLSDLVDPQTTDITEVNTLIDSKLVPTILTEGGKATKVRPNTSVVLGDSITAQNTGGIGGAQGAATLEPTLNAVGYIPWMLTLSGWPLNIVYYAGVGGNNTAQALARFDTDVAAYDPGYCIILIGTNDPSSGLTTVQTKANLTAIYTKCVENGIEPILCTLSPRKPYTGGDVALNAVWAAINPFIRQQAKDNGWRLLDFENSFPNRSASTVDISPSNALISSGDVVHPGIIGAFYMGREGAKGLIGLSKKNMPTANWNGGLVNPNACMLGNAGTNPSGATGNLPTGYSLFGTTTGLTLTKVARADGLEWLQIVVNDSGSVRELNLSQIITVASGAIVVGDTLELAVEYETDSGWTNPELIYASIVPQDAGSLDISASVKTTLFASSNDLLQGKMPTNPDSGIIVVPRCTLPTGTSRILTQFRFKLQSGTIRIGRYAVRKV